MRDTKAVGDISEAVVMAELIKRRKVVLLPFGERHRYDLVIEQTGKFVRVQCKTGRLRKGSILFNTSSVVRDAATKKYVKHYYSSEDIDLYAVYCPENEKVYLVPVQDMTKNGCLRLVPSAISKGMGGKTAEQYELES